MAVYRAIGDDQGPFDRAAPSRSRTIRCDPISDGDGRRPMPRSQSVSHINSLAPSSKVDGGAALSRTESASRFRKRLDLLRGNLIARVTGKRSDGGKAKDDGIGVFLQQKHEASAVRQSEVPAPQTVWNAADRSSGSASSPSSPTPSQSMFDRRRVQRRTPRRHRTVVVGEEVEAAAATGGFLRRNASSASSTRETQQPNVDAVAQLQQPRRFTGDTHQQDASTDVTPSVTDAVSHNDIERLQCIKR